MMRLTRTILICALAMLWPGAASAVLEFAYLSLVSSTNDGTGGFPSTQTFIPALPLVSLGGTIDEAAGTYSFSLPFFSIDVDILSTAPPPPADFRFDITGWGQSGTFAGGTGGAMTSSSAAGTTACFDYGPPGIGSVVCPAYPQAIPTWPPTGAAGGFGAAGATINLATNTITVTEGHDPNGGQIQNVYTYTTAAIPTLSEWGMMALGLLLLTAMIVTIRRRQQLRTA